MKYLIAFVVLLFFAGCIVEYRPDSERLTGLFLNDLVWTSDGNHILVLADSLPLNGSYIYSIRDYDKNGTLLQSYNFPGDYYSTNLSPSSDDTTLFFSSSNGGNYSVYRYFIGSQTATPVAGGVIYAESSDDKRLFVGPYSSSYQNNNNLLVVDVSNAKPRLEKSWYDPLPQYSSGVWIGNNNIGYLRYNSFNLIDFVITDTTGAKLDSFDLSTIPQLYSIQAFHGPGAFYFTGYSGIVKYDSSAKTSSVLSGDFLEAADIASDGSFIVYETSGSLIAINTHTGTRKELARNLSEYPKISPSGNQVAFIDKSNSSGGIVKVLPVSAP